MICTLPRAQVERFIQYVFVKIHSKKIADFNRLADDIYKETSEGNNANAISYIQMLPSIYLSLYASRKEVRDVVQPDQLSIAGPKIDEWQNIDTLKDYLGLIPKPEAQNQKLFVTSWKDLSIKAFNRIYQKSPKVVEGEQGFAVLNSTNYSKDVKIKVVKFSRNSLKTPFVPIVDTNGSKVAGIQLPVQHSDFYVAFEHQGNLMGYITPLQYYQDGKEITLDDLAGMIEMNEDDLAELKAAKPLYDALYARFQQALGTSNEVTLSLQEAGINLHPNFSKFEILEDSTLGQKAKQKESKTPILLSSASDHYFNKGKGLIIKSYNGSYLSENTDPDAPELPLYKDGSGNVKPFRGYFALVTMPNNKKYWVGIRPAILNKVSGAEVETFINRVNQAIQQLKNLSSRTPDNARAADAIANSLNQDYYFYTGSDYNVFFTTNYNELKGGYGLRADFLLKNSPIGTFVPSHYFDEFVDNLVDFLNKLNYSAATSVGIELNVDSLRKNIPYDKETGTYPRMTEEELGRSFVTTVSERIFQNAFFTFTINDAVEVSDKLEEVKQEAPKQTNTEGPLFTQEQLEAMQRAAMELQASVSNNNGDLPFKISDGSPTQSLTDSEIKDLKSILPKFISVEDIEVVAKNLNTKGIPLGMFKDKVLYLAKEVSKGVQFHEAFHAIFRTVLDDNQINNLLNEGKKRLLSIDPEALSTPNKENFVDIRGYTDLQDSQIEDLIVEEYLADSFQDYKNSKSGECSFIRNLFEKIMNFFKWLSGKNTDIERFFYSIKTGKFNNANQKFNKFNNIGYGVYDLIPNTSGVSESEAIVKTVAARLVENGKAKTTDLDEILDDLSDFYSINNAENRQGILNGTISPERLSRKYAIYTDPTTRSIIKKEVSSLLYKLYKYDIQTSELEELEEQYGRGTEGMWDKSIDEFGGFDGVNSIVRRFILMTTYVVNDSVTGKPVRQVIDGEYIYANLERALAGKSRQDVIEGLKALAKINPQIDAVWQNLKSKTGLVESTDDAVGNESSFSDLDPKNYEDNIDGKMFMTTFLKALEKNFVNHLQVVVDYSDPETGAKSRIFSSNRNDAPSIQLQRWQQNYMGSIYETFKDNESLRASTAADLISFIRTYNSGKTTESDLESLRKTLWSLGLEFSPAYIKMSFGSPSDSVVVSLRSAFRDVEKLSTPFIDKIAEYLNNNRNLFERGDMTTAIVENKVVDMGLTSTIKTYVAGNVLFDTNIFQTNFQTADNKTRYSYVYPNYYVNKVNSLREKLSNPSEVRTLQENDYYKYNHLLNIYSSKEISAQIGAANFRNFNAELAGDIREEVTLEDGDSKLNQGLVFKDTDVKALLLTNLALFSNRTTKNVSYVVDGVRQSQKVEYAKFWPLQLEAKSTMLTVELPVLNGISGGGYLTKEGERYLRGYISQEIARIGILTKPISERNNAYRIDNKRNEFVYFKFLNNPLVDAILEIKRDAKGNIIERKAKVSSQDIDLIVQEARKGLFSEFTSFKNKINENFILPLLEARSINNYGSVDNYLSEYFYNHLFNSIGTKQLMFGDESQFKDDVDLVKRAGGLLAFGVSRGDRIYKSAYTTEAIEYIYSDSLKNGGKDTVRVTRNNNESLEEFKSRLSSGLSDGSIIEINSDDAGSEMTAQEYIDVLYDLGRLDSRKLEALNLLKDGIKPGSEEESRYNELVNEISRKEGKDSSLAIDAVSLKLVSFGDDGVGNMYYDKMSVGVLFKNFTSRWDESSGKWVAQLGLEALHNKRVWMEKNGIGQVNPKSAGKLKTGPLFDNRKFRGLVLDESSNLPEDMFYQPQNRFGKDQRLQVEVESHGMGKITALSQAIQLIDTEVSEKMEPLRKEYQETLTELRNTAFKEAFDLVSKDIISENTSSRDIRLFLAKVRDTIASTTPSPSVLEFLQTEGTDTKYDFNVPAVVGKLENVFLAHFNSDTFVQKIPGRSFILRSSRDYKVIENLSDGTVVSREQYTRSKNPELYETEKYTTRELRIHKKVDGNVQYAEVVISRGTAELFGLKIGSTIPEELLIGFGVRIPTQSHHSMIPFKVVDFLPDYMGDTIIAPKEIVYLSGADYDIDKLFAYLKAFYTSGNKIKLYGSATTPEERFFEYYKWERKNNTSFKRLIDEYKNEYQIDNLRREKISILRRLYLGPIDDAFDSLVESLAIDSGNDSGKFKDFFEKLEESVSYVHGTNSSKKDLVKAYADRIESIASEIAKVEKRAYQQAATDLGFPTLEDFKNNPNIKSKGELYNKLIDIHIKFATNNEDTVVESLMTPASTKPLEEDAKLIAKITGSKEGKFIGSSINGIIDSWTNNVQGKRLVGIWANSNVVSANLTKNKVKLNFTYAPVFDDVVYADFGKEKEDDAVIAEDLSSYRIDKDLRRKADSISSGVSSATDNAKERLMARLNYDDDNTGVYSMMMALGAGRTRTNLFASQPAILEYNKSLSGAKTRIRKVGVKSKLLDIMVSKAKKNLIDEFSKEGIVATSNMLSEVAMSSISTQSMVEDLKRNLSGLAKAKHDYAVISTFSRMKDVQEYAMNYAKLISINRGIESKFSYIENVFDAAELLDLGDLVGRPRRTDYDRSNIPFKVRDVVLNKDYNIKSNIENLYSVNNISSKFFIKNTEWYKNTVNNLVDSTLRIPGGALGDEAMAYLEKGLFNFIVSNAYGKFLKEVKGIELKDYAGLVYNRLGEETLKSKFKSLLAKKEFSSNELVRFIQTDVKGVTDRVYTNTRMKTTAKTEQRFIDAYEALLNSKDKDVRQFAIDLFGYLLVKDGGMFGNASIIKFVKPSMFYNMAKILREFNKAIYTNDEEAIKDLTGMTSTQLRNRFYKIYVSDFVNSRYLRTLPMDDILDSSGIVVDSKIASSIKGYSKSGEFDVYKLNIEGNTLTITSSPIREVGSLGKSTFMDYTVKDGEVSLNPPKAVVYPGDGVNPRITFILNGIDRSKGQDGYTKYTFTYKPSIIFGSKDYNPYTLPYEFSAKNFNFGTKPVEKVVNNKKPVGSLRVYQGMITKLKENQVFVFGSNPEGRHGAGAARQAMSFGAIYGQGRGPQGFTYALVTKNLRTGYTEPSTGIVYDQEGERSVSAAQISNNIKELYDYANANKDKEFLIAYSGLSRSNLNGYSNEEMAALFKSHTIPENIVFEENFAKLIQGQYVSRTPVFDTLPAKSSVPTKTYAGIGSRSTPVEIMNVIRELSKELENRGYKLRTGDADGADAAFRESTKNKEVYTASDSNDKARAIALEIHPNPSAITGNPYILNLMARNTFQVFGKNMDIPVDFVIAWTPDGATNPSERTRKTGGTGQAIAMAAMKGIPVINLAREDWRRQLDDILGNSTPEKTEVGNQEAPTTSVRRTRLGEVTYSRKNRFEYTDTYGSTFIGYDIDIDNYPEFTGAVVKTEQGWVIIDKISKKFIRSIPFKTIKESINELKTFIANLDITDSNITTLESIGLYSKESDPSWDMDDNDSETPFEC